MMEQDDAISTIFLNHYAGYYPAVKVSLYLKKLFNENLIRKPIVCRLRGQGVEEALASLREIDSKLLIIE